MAWEDRRVMRARRAAAQPKDRAENTKNGSQRLAALDIGTHAVKLLAVSATWDRWGLELVPLFRGGIVTRLGAGVGNGTRGRPISVAAEARARQAIAELAERARGLGIERWIAAGTGVLRRARNGEAVAGRLGAELEIEVPVLSPETEAALAILGARAGAGPEPPLLGIDLGGGSTELIYVGAADGRRAAFGVRSLDLGCLVLAERHLAGRGRKRGREAADRLQRALTRALPRPLLQVPAGSQAPSWLAIGGTTTALATMDLGLPVHDPDRVHGHRLTATAIERLAAELLAEIARPGRPSGEWARPFHRQPAPVLLAGALLLRHLMAMHAVRVVTASTFGLRHGLILSALCAHRRRTDPGPPGDPRRSPGIAIELARNPLPRIRNGRSKIWKEARAKRIDASVHPQ